jgi:predicted MFS family arabinose efflux permease
MDRRLIAACCTAPVLVAVDFAAFAVAAPRIAGDLGGGAASIGWAYSGYSLVFGACLIPAGRVADLHGRRAALIRGLAVFGTAAAAAACAPGIGWLIGARAVQGAGAALMTPAAISLLTAGADERERQRRLGAYGMAISAGFVLGSLVSGVVAATGGWRWALVLAAPLAVAGALAGRGIAEPARAQGAVRSPVLALRGVRAACAAGFVVTGTGVAATLLLTLDLQQARHASPLEAAGAFALFGLIAPLGARAAALLAVRRSAGALLASGLAAQGGALLGLAAAVAATGLVPLLAGIAAFGFGHILGNVAALTVATAASARPAQARAAAALSALQYLGGATGGAAAGVAADAVPAGLAAGGLAALAAAGLALARGRR